MEQKKDSPPLDLLQFYGRSHIKLYPGGDRGYSSIKTMERCPTIQVLGWLVWGGKYEFLCDIFRMKDFRQGDFFGRIDPFIHTLTLVSTSLQWPLSSVPKVAIVEIVPSTSTIAIL